MTLTLLGINVLIFMAVWHFMVKKTLLDHTRDKLFDLRDEIRSVHLARGWTIDGDVYGNLRDMLNAYLMYTEAYSVWKVVVVRTEISKAANAGLRDHLAARIESRFKTSSVEQRQYIANVRSRAANALIEYSVYSSGLLLLASMLMTPYFLVSTLLAQCRKGFSALGHVFARDVLHLGRVLRYVWSASTIWVASRVIDHQSLDVAISSDNHGFA